MDTEQSTSPQKARSRLKNNRDNMPVVHSLHKRTKNAVTVEHPLLKKYLKFSPLLIVAILHLGLLSYVVRTVAPETWQHFLIPNSYLPMLLLLIATVFWFSSYLFLNTARGIRFSLFAGIFFFLKVQSVILSSSFVVVVIGLFVLSEICIYFLTMIGHSKKQ
ncbi:hypothetical protein KC721_02505 [Candidatus Woesebacteria bacterium]|nr:hypothetical protein [Candidatus Woesebacteria bacterium]